MNIFFKQAFFALAILFIGFSTACVPIDGGAAELSWGIRSETGDPIDDTATSDCNVAGLGWVRLCWQPRENTDGGPEEIRCQSAQYRDFSCELHRGVTQFEIPTGDTTFFIQPICKDGRIPAGPYDVPPPIVKSVQNGAVVSLSQLLIVVDPAKTCEEMTNNAAQQRSGQ